jgi:hypothetical protein
MQMVGMKTRYQGHRQRLFSLISQGGMHTRCLAEGRDSLLKFSSLRGGGTLLRNSGCVQNPNNGVER